MNYYFTLFQAHFLQKEFKIALTILQVFVAKSCSVDLSSGDPLRLELWLCYCRDLQATLLSGLQTPKT